MKKIITVLFLILCTPAVHAQFTVRIIVTDTTAKVQDDIYVAGNFNNWNPADNDTKLKPFADNSRVIVFDDVDPGLYEYKFTRGSWDKVETTARSWRRSYLLG